MAKAIVGSHYDPSKEVDLTLEQASFFFYLLELAIKTCHTWMAKHKPTI